MYFLCVFNEYEHYSYCNPELSTYAKIPFHYSNRFVSLLLCLMLEKLHQLRYLEKFVKLDVIDYIFLLKKKWLKLFQSIKKDGTNDKCFDLRRCFMKIDNFWEFLMIFDGTLQKKSWLKYFGAHLKSQIYRNSSNIANFVWNCFNCLSIKRGRKKIADVVRRFGLFWIRNFVALNLK